MRYRAMVLCLALALGAQGRPYDWVPGPFQKRSQPIFVPSQSGLDSKNVYNMAVIKRGATTFMVYRGESLLDTAQTNTGRLFLATSTDGLEFERRAEPVLVPDQPYESRGVEDPRIIYVGDTYYLTYTAYDGKLARLCEATSQDLLHWTKLGPMFANFAEGNEVTPLGWTKSGAIFDQPIEAGPYAGKYVIYFGESDMWMGYSDDLRHWSYRPEPVLRRRPDRGDSRVCEPGPPPIRTREGILLLYAGDVLAHCPYVTYAALFDAAQPDRVLRRTDRPLLEPTLPWEKVGYVPNVVFAESLVHEGDLWRLYYGAADHVIGVAEAPYEADLMRR